LVHPPVHSNRRATPDGGGGVMLADGFVDGLGDALSMTIGSSSGSTSWSGRAPVRGGTRLSPLDERGRRVGRLAGVPRTPTRRACDAASARSRWMWSACSSSRIRVHVHGDLLRG
jgi:hypothetical protein